MLYRSIKTKILLGLFLTIAISISLVFVYIFNTVQDASISSYVTFTLREIKQLDNAMNIFMEEAKYNATMLSMDPRVRDVDDSITSFVDTTVKTKSIPRPDDAKGRSITDLLTLMGASHPAYVEVFFGTEYGGFLSNAETAMPIGYDPRKRPWYREAMQHPQAPIVSKAYMSTTGEAVVVSVVKVVEEKGKTVGAIGVDISLKVLTDIVKDIKIGETGYVVFVQGDGVVISDPKHPDYNFKNISELEISGLSTAFDLGSGHTMVEMEGKRYLALCHTAPALQWTFLTFIDYDEISAPINNLLWRSTIAIILSLIVICLIILPFMNALVFKPLNFMIHHPQEYREWKVR